MQALLDETPMGRKDSYWRVKKIQRGNIAVYIVLDQRQKVTQLNLVDQIIFLIRRCAGVTTDGARAREAIRRWRRFHIMPIVEPAMSSALNNRRLPVVSGAVVNRERLATLLPGGGAHIGVACSGP